MSFGEAIKKLRKEAGLSQQEVANKLGMARATYASLEVDRREPDLGELNAIAELYEISMMELVAEEGDDWPGVIHEPSVQYARRINVNSRYGKKTLKSDSDKLREVLLYVLAAIGARPTFGESVLYKILYFIDFTYYEKFDRSITGINYIRNSYGPTPTLAFIDIVKQMQAKSELEIVTTKHFNNTQKKYLPIVAPDLHSIDATELKHIDKILEWHGDKSAAELFDLLIMDVSWNATKPGQSINYIST